MQMIALTKDGDTKNTWNVDDPDDCAQAEAMFNDYKSSGFSAFRVDGDVHTSVTEFDPTLGTVLFIPAMVGG